MKTLSTNLKVRTLVFSALLGLITVTFTPLATSQVANPPQGGVTPDGNTYGSFKWTYDERGDTRPKSTGVAKTKDSYYPEFDG